MTLSSLFPSFLLLFLFKFSLQFSEETIKFAVSEDAPINTIIGHLNQENGFSYRLSRGNSKIRFDEQTLEFSISSPLDRESENAIDMLIISSPPSIIHVLIEILDVNDNPPRFATGTQKVEIPETAPIGWRVSISGATDADAGQNGTIGGYELTETIEKTSEDVTTPFSIVEEDGFLYLEVTGRLDREQKDLYAMKLTAKDEGSPQLSSSCLLNIIILDINDNPPDFGIRSLRLDWNGKPSTVLFHLNATDADSGENGRLIYSILPPANGMISISDGNLLVTQNNTLSLCSPRCEFVVEARDSGVPPLTSTLNVELRVEYGNEHEPNINIRFYPADFPFIVVQPEDVNGKTLAILSLTDADGPLGDNASIWIQSGNEDSIFSLISRQSINILTLKNVEKATKDVYILEFEANDGQNPIERKTRKQLKVFFKQYVKSTHVHVASEFHVEVEKDTVPGSFVAHVITNCSDSCSFELLNSEFFKIDSTNGIIVTSSVLPDDVNSFHLPVKVHLPPPSTEILETDVFVKILKDAITPKNLIRSDHTTVHLKRAYTFSTWQNVSVGTVVGRLPKTQVYSTNDVSSELGIFPDGAVFIGKPINNDFLTLPVTLKDRNTTQTSLVTVIVKPLEENRIECSDDVTKIHVSEDVPVGSVIGRLNSGSPNAVVFYRLLNSDSDSNVIYVEKSGNIRSLKKFDAEQRRNYTFSYEISNYGVQQKSQNCSGIVLVEDVNDNNPKFSSKYYSTKINGDKGNLVVILHADDEDVEEKNRKIQYRLLNLNDFFHVDSDSGRVVTIQNIPKTWKRLNLTVEAVNVASENYLKSQSFVLVTIVNSTEVKIRLESEDVLKVYRSDTVGMKIGQIQLTSSDSVFWKTNDTRFFLNSQGDVILKKRTRSTENFDVTIGTSSGFQKVLKHKVEFVNSQRNDNAEDVVEVVIEKNQTDILSVEKNWKIVKVVKDGNQTSPFYIENGKLHTLNSEDVQDSYVFLESTEENHGFKVIHVIPPSSTTSSESTCFSTVHLITPPATVTLPSNCTDVNLQKTQKPLQIHEGNLLIPSQSELINHVDLTSEKTKPFMITLIKDEPTEEVKFASNNVLMLLSSVHNIGASFGRVTAESAYRIRYYLVGSNQVSIDADTGELFLKERFYRNLNEIQIIAVIPTGIAKAKVSIEVIEDRLVLPKSNFVIIAPNSFMKMEMIGRISVGRDDVIVDVIDDHFYSRKDEIFVKKHFHPISNFYELEGIVKKGKLSSPINITIFFGRNSEDVQDLKENELMFEVEENSPIGTVLGVVPNKSKFRLVDASCGLLIDQDGVIRTTSSFDREKTSLLKTKMIEPSANRIWDLLVFIGDINDNKPKIVNAPGRIVIGSEDVQKTSVVYKLLWEDSDDVATDVSFEVIDGDPFNHLKINDNGEILLNSTPSESFNATIRIYDNRPPFQVNSHEVTIEFQVSKTPEDVKCENSDFWILGNIPKKYEVIGKISGEGQKTWRILPDSLPRAEFLIDPMTGEIRINSEDVKNNDFFNLEIQVMSYDGKQSGFCHVTISVGDVTSSQEELKFDDTSLEFHVSETTDRGVEIGRVRLLNNSDDVVFRLLNDFNFTISPFDGALFVNSPLDYEDVKTYKIHVIADNSVHSAHCDVIIHVTDENDETPRFITGDVVHLKVLEEEKTLNYPLVIGSSIAEDLDEGQNGIVTYSILSGNTSIFAVNSTTGEILSLGPLDREDSDLHELEIEAKDAGIPSLSATSKILVHVEDVNDNPPEFLQTSYIVRIPENTPFGSKIIRIQANDRDLNSVLQYSLDEDSVSDPFRIDVATGWITVSGKVDREDKEIYEITVHVKDGKWSSKCILLILIEDVNDNSPVIENQNIDIFVSSEVQEGDLLHVIDVHDADVKDHLKFSSNGTDSDLFEVTPYGEILAKQGGFTTKSYFTVEVTVTDEIGHSTSSEYTFYLHPAKEFPIWKERMESLSVKEHENQELAIFKAKGQGVRYSIVSKCRDHLTIETISGILSSKSTLDREMFSECPVFVVATKFIDNKPLSVITKLLIKVVDINDNSPLFDEQLYHFNVTENSGPVPVGRIIARDSDANSRVFYEIVSGDKNHEFMITESGEIETIRDLDRESQSEYHLIVEAIDDGKPRRRGNTTVIVKVLDEDDNAPRFSRIFHVEIPEDIKIGAFVIQLSASDSDEMANHQFALEGDDLPFRVEKETGNVFVNQTLDYEKKSSYRIKVRLTDGVWLIETSLFVNLRDVNDNSPVFQRPEYFFISDDSSSVIGNVTASDIDSDLNGKIRYSLTSPYFRISPESGEITRLRPLPEAVTSIEVTASDHGVPSLQSSVIIHVAEKKMFKEVREERIRETVQNGDVIGNEFSIDSHVFPRDSGIILTQKGQLIVNEDVKGSDVFWIIDTTNSRITTYTIVKDISTSELLNGTSHIEVTVNRTSSIGDVLTKLIVHGCSNFERLPNSDVFQIESDGSLRLIGAFSNQTTFTAECNDGTWPRQNQKMEVAVKFQKTLEEDVFELNVVPPKDNHEKNLPKTLKIETSSESTSGTILWKNKNKMVVFMENNEQIGTKNGDLILKESLTSSKVFDVFGRGFKRSSISIVPSKEVVKCPVFPQKHYFIESFGNISQLYELFENSEEMKCRIRIQNIEMRKMFHLNGFQLISIQPLLPGTYQLHLVISSESDDVITSESHLTVTVPHLTSSEVPPVIPLVIFSRENSTTSPHNPLIRIPSTFTLTDESTFAVTDSGAIWSRSILKSSSRSVYRIPITRKGQKNQKTSQFIRVLLDDVIDDSEDVQKEKKLEFTIIDNFKKIHDIQIASKSECHPKYVDVFEVTKDCHVITPSTYSNISIPIDIRNSTWNVNIINEQSEDVKLQRNAVELGFIGQKSSISHLLNDLRRTYNDMKIKCLAVWTSDDVNFSATFAMIDRNDVIIDAVETQKTLTSFLEKHRPNYLDFIEFRSGHCEGVTCVQNGTTCQTALTSSSFKRVVSRSGFNILDVPNEKLIGRCECVTPLECKTEDVPVLMKQMDEVMEKETPRRHQNCEEMNCGSNGKCVMDEKTNEPFCRCVEGKSNGFESSYNCDKSNDVFSMSSGANGHLDVKVKNETEFLLKTSCDKSCDGVQQIELDFRTFQTKSELLVVDFGKQKAIVEMTSGYVSFGLSDEYTRPIQTRIEKTVNDGRWHRLLFQMSNGGKKISIQIDGRGKEVKSRVPLPMLLTAKNIRIVTSSEFCFRRILAQNQFIHPVLHKNRLFEVTSSMSSVDSTCQIEINSPDGFFSNFSDTTTVILLSVLIIISIIAVAVCLLAIRRRWLQNKTSSGTSRGSSGWTKATEIDAFAVNPHRRGHVNRTMMKSPDDDTYDSATVYDRNPMKSTDIYTTSASRRYQPVVHNHRRDGHINMAYL